MKSFRSIACLTALFAAFASSEAADQDWSNPANCCWVTPRTAEGDEVWWFASKDNWMRNSDSAHEFPAANENAYFTSGVKYPPLVYLKAGDDVTLTGLVLGGDNMFYEPVVEIRSGAKLTVTGTGNGSDCKGVMVGNKQYSYPVLRVNGGLLDCKALHLSGLYGAGSDSRLEVTNGGVVVCSYLYLCGNAPNKATVCVSGAGSVITNTGTTGVSVYARDKVYGWVRICDGAKFVGSAVSGFGLGGGSGEKSYSEVVCSNAYMEIGPMSLRSQATFRLDKGGRAYVARGCGWAMSSPGLQFNDTLATTTQKVEIADAVFNMNDNDSTSVRWQIVSFQTAGTASFVQRNSCVTNCGIRFSNYNGTASATEPRYEVDGGSLFIFSKNNAKDANPCGHPNGEACNGIGVFNTAPEGGTFSMRGYPSVDIPRVLTNVLVSGTGHEGTAEGAGARVFDSTPYRPHLEYLFDGRGINPVLIRDQTGIVGQFSVVPEGGLQLVSTNRFALLRHKTGEALSTYDEPQFRALNPSLWTTGAFADRADEWGVALKDAAKIALGAPLASPVAAGWIELPRLKAAAVKNAKVWLKLQARLQTVAEAVAAMVAAGYDAVELSEGDYNVCVNVPSSSFGEKREDRRVVFDFNARRTAVQVRDNAYAPNVTVAAADFTCERPGLMLLFR